MWRAILLWLSHARRTGNCKDNQGIRVQSTREAVCNFREITLMPKEWYRLRPASRCSQFFFEHQCRCFQTALASCHRRKHHCLFRTPWACQLRIAPRILRFQGTRHRLSLHTSFRKTIRIRTSSRRSEWLHRLESCNKREYWALAWRLSENSWSAKQTCVWWMGWSNLCNYCSHRHRDHRGLRDLLRMISIYSLNPKLYSPSMNLISTNQWKSNQMWLWYPWLAVLHFKDVKSSKQAQSPF